MAGGVTAAIAGLVAFATQAPEAAVSFRRLGAVLGAEESAPRAAILERAETYADRQGVHDLGPDFVLIVEANRTGTLISRKTQALEEIESMSAALAALAQAKPSLNGRMESMPAATKAYLADALARRYPLNATKGMQFPSDVAYQIRGHKRVTYRIGDHSVEVMYGDREAIGDKVTAKKRMKVLDDHPLPLRVQPDKIDAFIREDMARASRVGFKETWRVSLIRRPIDCREEEEILRTSGVFAEYLKSVRERAMEAAAPMEDWLSPRLRDFQVGQDPSGLTKEEHEALMTILQQKCGELGIPWDPAAAGRARIEAVRPHWIALFAAEPSNRMTLASVPLTPR